jgi:mycothiol S-conjugate amidase
MWSRARIAGLHEKFLELDLDSPYDEWWFERPSKDHLITTQVSTTDHWDVRGEALLAHATQIDPASKFWFGLPDDVARTVHPFDDYRLGACYVDGYSVDPSSVLPAEGHEDDLFAGIRTEMVS